MKEIIYGRNPVYEALRAGRRTPLGLVIAEGVKRGPKLQEIEALCKRKKIPVQRVDRSQMDKIGSGHQGVALQVNGYPYAGLGDIMGQALAEGKPPFILILDSLQDPQNLGTLLRTAEAFGVHGVCIPPRQSAKVTPAVVSASSGASEHLRIAQINLVHAIHEMKEAGMWVVGLDHAAGGRRPDQIDVSGPIALVVGSEGQGLRRLVRKSCDHLMRIPMGGEIESLNAAIAGSIALYLIARARLH